MLKYLKGDDWIALGVGMVGFTLLMPITAIVEDYGVLNLAAIVRNGALLNLAQKKYMNLASVGLALDIFYVPVSAIALRSVNFRGFLKYPFCLLVFPVFGVLMIYNIEWSSEHLGWLVGQAGSGSSKSRAGPGLLAAVPLPTAVCALWYLLFAVVDRVLPGRTRKGEDGSSEN